MFTNRIPVSQRKFTIIYVGLSFEKKYFIFIVEIYVGNMKKNMFALVRMLRSQILVLVSWVCFSKNASESNTCVSKLGLL